MNPTTNICEKCEIDNCWDCQTATACKNCYFGFSWNGTECVKITTCK